MNQMARFCAEDNTKLIEYLKNKGIIHSSIVFETMCLVDRKKYVNNFNPFNNAYIDAPQNIGHGRTISAPHMHGVVFEILAKKLTSAKNVLCIRCSTGYVSNCMAMIMGPYGTVFQIESVPELKEKIKKTIENAHPYLLWGNRIRLLDVENEIDGYPQPELRYDVIYVGAAAAEIPQALIDQLAFGGRMIIPIGPKEEQKLIQIDRTSDGKIERKTLMSVRYGYLDDTRKITKENVVLGIRRKNNSNEISSASNLSSENVNITSEIITTQSSKKIQNNLLTKPVQNFSSSCMKVEIASIPTERLEIKHAEKDVQKKEIESLQTIYHELIPTLEKKLNAQIGRKDDVQYFQKEEDAHQNNQHVLSPHLKSKLETVLDKNFEIKTIINKLRPTYTNKMLEEKIEEIFDKAVEKLKNDLKVEDLQSIYTDDLMKKLTFLLDKKLETKFDENVNVKIGTIEQRVILLEIQIKKFSDILKQETNEQKIFLCEMDKALKLKIEKLRNKIGSTENDNKIIERKLNNKIIKTKECIYEKIMDEVEELNKQLKMTEETNELFAKEIKILSKAFEERILQEKANIYMQIDAKLKKTEEKQLSSVKNNIACFEKEMESLKKKLADIETKKRNQWCYCFIAFPTIITLHATYALYKNLL